MNIHTINPTVRHVDAPPALRALPAWLIWRFEPNPGGGKPRKVPYYASGARRRGTQGNEADVASLVTFEAAKTAAARRGFDGVGFATLPQFRVTALDFDDCMPEGRIHPQVAEVVSSTYAEFSPSGQGVRAFFSGHIPTGKSHKAPGLDYGFEVFSTSGFVTFTGNVLPECELLGTDTEISEITPAVRELHAHRFGRAEQGLQGAEPGQDRPDVTMADIEAILARLDPSLGHDDWLQVGMGLHHQLGDEGFAIWDAWSSASDKYPGEEALRTRWLSFGRRADGRDVTLRTAMKLAGVHTAPATADEFEDATEQAAQAVAAEAAAPLRFPFEPAATFASAQGLPWVIKGVLPKAGLAVVYGASGSGKSFAVLDMGMAIARGVEWRNRKTRQGRVCYVAAEGAGGFRKRVAAYAQHHQLDLAGLPFFVLGAAPNLMESQDAKDLIKGVKAAGGADLIVVDTLAQSMPGANENAGEDMGKVLGYCKKIHEITGATVLLVHHSGKDQAKGARGWSGLRAACDAELEVTREITARAIRLTKSKDGADDLEFGFDLEVVQLGVDEDLDPITSCAVVEAAVPARGGQPDRKLGPVEKVVNDVIQEMAQAQTEGIEVGPVIAESVKRLGPPAEGKRDTRKQHVRRALESLCKGDAAPYWLGEDGTLSVC